MPVLFCFALGFVVVAIVAALVRGWLRMVDAGADWWIFRRRQRDDRREAQAVAESTRRHGAPYPLTPWAAFRRATRRPK